MKKHQNWNLVIDSGPITAESKLDDVPQEQWRLLMGHREMFVKAHLPHDCRCLVNFVADAQRMYKPLGFKDSDDFIARGLKLEPAEIRLAVDWLKLNKPEEPIPLEVVHKLVKHGGKRVKGEQGSIRTLKRGTTRAYILARLERDGFTELAAKVRSGELSANTAAIKARFPGFGKKLVRRCPRCGHEW